MTRDTEIIVNYPSKNKKEIGTCVTSVYPSRVPQPFRLHDVVLRRGVKLTGIFIICQFLNFFVRIVKSMNIGWTGHVARVQETRNAYGTSVGNLLEEGH
jgi:hypothetical protein